MTKSAHFMPGKTTYAAKYYARLYIQQLVILHGVPVSIISNKGAQFTVQIWKYFQTGLCSKVNLSTKNLLKNDTQKRRTAMLYWSELTEKRRNQVRRFWLDGFPKETECVTFDFFFKKYFLISNGLLRFFYIIKKRCSSSLILNFCNILKF
ncbi:hypothetical protein MTR67_023001 [Solanum verrucosum]|uniref:Integrase catalytic domain-containing protein n=1 Tax=Solanum verrucosum TaxID=315347 RepID=A0AAF0TRF3_SOLVR|nr:hypothetical protein MTR67_023001 [Solanum verrucosum]